MAMSDLLITTERLREILRRSCGDAGSQHAWAKAHGVSPAYVSDVLAGRREPGDAICDALGFERLTLYTRSDRPDQRRADSLRHALLTVRENLAQRPETPPQALVEYCDQQLAAAHGKEG